MITSLPAVQFSCKKARRIVVINSRHTAAGSYKELANRRHRRHLNARTRRFIVDPDLFDREGFDAPSLSCWDLC